MLLNFILLDSAASGAAEAGGNTGGGFSGIFMIIAIIAIFYFMMVRPQQKKQKEIRRFREGLAVGDKVITAGGIHGKIVGIKDNHFVISVANGVEIKVDKGSVYPNAAEQQAAQKQEEGKN